MTTARALRSNAEVDRRTARIRERHVAPLNDWVVGLRERLGPSAIVPWFDPADGGVEARVLWLLEAPGPRATRERGGSGFISCDNNDTTAQNSLLTREEAGLDRSVVVHWNVVPYYLGDQQRIRAMAPTDALSAGPLLKELLALLPHLSVVILGGAAAKRVWMAHAPRGDGLFVIECPHPSPTNVNTRPEARALIVAAWAEAKRHVGRL